MPACQQEAATFLSLSTRQALTDVHRRTIMVPMPRSKSAPTTPPDDSQPPPEWLTEPQPDDVPGWLTAPTETEPLSRGDHVELVDRLVEAITAEYGLQDAEALSERLVFDHGAFWSCLAHPHHVFTPIDPFRIDRRIEAFAGAPVFARLDPKTGEPVYRPLKLNDGDLSGTMRRFESRCAHPRFFDDARRGIATRAGVFVLGTARLERLDLSPRLRVRSFLDLDPFEGLAPDVVTQVLAPESPTHARIVEDHLLEGTRLGTMLRTVFRGLPDADDVRLLLGEFFGLAILGLAPSRGKCLFLLGDGNNGKSTVLTVLSGVFPAGTVTSASPGDLAHEYHRATLAGSRLNVVEELAENRLPETDQFKNCVTGGMVRGRHPGGRPFDYRCEAGFALALNELPPIGDGTAGFWRRPLVVPFNRAIPAAEVIIDLDQLILATERPRVLAWLLASAARVIQANAYTLPSSVTDATTEWRSDADAFAAWFSDGYRPFDRATEPSLNPLQSKVLYERYLHYCRDNGFKHPVSITRFGRRLKALSHAEKRQPSGTVHYDVTERSSADTRGHAWH